MYNKILEFWSKYNNIGLLLMRIGIGICFMIHGYPKLTGGPAKWEWLGANMSNLGITFAPKFWGFMAASAEFFGGMFLVLGLAFPLVCILLLFTMFVAMAFHLASEDDFMKYSHALESGIVFLSLAVAGPGVYSLDYMLFNNKK